ncbi:MAG: hypothetical protein Q9207_001822 [Kuettlingeria erythrocarpa]
MPTAEEAHVPAWKRLGLKLQSAQEQAESGPVVFYSAPAKTKKRKSEIHDDDAGVDATSSKPPKKSKKSKERNGHIAVLKRSPQPTAIPSTTPRKPSLTRKLVSFTPETKVEDGDSTKDLYNIWLASQKASDPSFDASSFNQDALNDITPPTVKPATAPSITTTTSHNFTPTSSSTPALPSNIKPTKKKKKKKRNKSKSTTLPSSSSTAKTTTSSLTTNPSSHSPPATTTTHPALTYLLTHHTSPATWKFSKSRSSYLLRHLFCPNHIPDSYTPALSSYLSGLQGRNAKQKLVEEALQIRKEDEEWLAQDGVFEGDDDGWKGIGGTGGEDMDDPKKRREVFLRAVKEHEALLKESVEAKEEAERDRIWREKLVRRRRAEMVLGIFDEGVGGPVRSVAGGKDEQREVGNSNGGIAVAQKRPLPNGGVKLKPKRKRKRRTTGVPDDESSSSSSSSSSSEGSSDTDDGPDAKRTKAGVLNGVNGHAVDLTSESSSSGEEGTNEDDTSSSGGSSDSDSSNDG